MKTDCTYMNFPFSLGNVTVSDGLTIIDPIQFELNKNLMVIAMAFKDYDTATARRRFKRYMY